MSTFFIRLKLARAFVIFLALDQECILSACAKFVYSVSTGRLSLDDCRWAFGGTLFGQSPVTALEQEENEDGPLGRSMHRLS